MKKALSILLATTLMVGAMFSLTGCGKKDGTDGDKGGSKGTDVKEIALITDVGTIDDKSFNQGSWEGVKQYGDETKTGYKYYKPVEKSSKACLDAIDQAVKDGAKVIVTPGFLFEAPIATAQDKYPDVKFVFVDGAPKAEGENTEYKIGANTLSITYAEEQAGFLAGYAAVKDGYKKMGFMGGIAVPAVVRYGYGYIQGAEAAAKELGLAKGDVDIRYTYVGNFDASPDNQSKASAWYNDGCEVIFGCGGGVGFSVMSAADANNKKTIGVDVDQSGESKSVITSSMKQLKKSVYDAVKSVYDNKFAGGTAVVLDAAVDGVGLPMATSKFTKFTQADYDAVFAKLVKNEIAIKKDSDAKEPTDLGTELVTVNFIK